MDETLHQRCLDALHRTLAAEVGPQASARVVVLFGSQASGRARASSDVDLGIALEAPMDAALRERVAASVAASIGRDVDLVDLLTAPSHLVSQALRTGTLLAGARGPRVQDGRRAGRHRAVPAANARSEEPVTMRAGRVFPARAQAARGR